MTPPQERTEHVGALGACLCFQSRDFFSTFVSFKRDVFCVFATGALLNPVHGGIYLTIANHTSGQNENNFASLPSPAANFFLTDFFPSPATHDWLNERGYEASHKNTHSQVFCLSFCAVLEKRTRRKTSQVRKKSKVKRKQNRLWTKLCTCYPMLHVLYGYQNSNLQSTVNHGVKIKENSTLNYGSAF